MALMRTLHRAVCDWRRLTPALAVACLLLASTPSGAQVGAPAWWGTFDNDTVSLSFLFPQSNWPPMPDFAAAPAWYAGTTWTRGGPKTPQWAALVSGHTGVWGIADGLAGQGELAIRLDNQYRPGWIKHVWYQFDLYQVGAQTCCLHGSGDVGSILNEHATTEELPFGWQRVTGSFDILPQPDWEQFTWQFDVQAAGKAAIDNLHIGARCEVPEPSALVALASPVLALIAARRRR